MYEDAIDAIDTARDKATATAKMVRMAELAFDELTGKNQDGITVIVIGEHVIIDDAHDRWLAKKSDYVTGVADVVSKIANGKIKTQPDDVTINAYEAICCKRIALFSDMGSPSDLPFLREYLKRNVTAEQRAKIFEELAIEDRITA